MNTLNNTNNILQTEQKKIYPVKDFLLARSRLVEFNKKIEAGEKLNKQELAKERRIHELRDKVLGKIRDEIAKYYEVAIEGNYSYDGMPKIKGGIRGGIEEKIGGLLVLIGDPNQDDNPYIGNKVSKKFGEEA